MDKSTTRYKIQSIGNKLYTLAAFVGFVSLTPAFICIYFYVQIYRSVWYSWLGKRYPHLELVSKLSVRSAMDTYRSQGILTILLQIRGQCNIDLIKQKIQEDVLEKRNSDGSLRFPHMKKTLTSCWGRYAWVKDTSEFSIHNQVIHVQNPVSRNRVLVTSANIQEFVSEVVTKYLPPWNNVPPWQIMVITTEADRFYILARVHHIYFAEDNISFSHLLMINPEDNWVQTDLQDMDSIENIVHQIYRKPRASPFIYDQLRELFLNFWDDIVCTYDPTVNPRIHSSHPHIFQFFMICLVTAFAVFQQYFHDKKKSFIRVVLEETRKRRVTVHFYCECLINTMFPSVIIKLTISWFWFIYIKCLLHFPITVLHMLYDTPMYLKWFLIIMRSLTELIYVFQLIYRTPRMLLDELIRPMFHLPFHYLQRVSLSGRKVVSWSDPIPIKLIHKIRDKTGVASCEIQLYGLAAALQNFFRKNNLNLPEEVLSTARFIPQEDLLKPANAISSGLLCLALPVNIPEDDALYGLHMVQLSLQDAMSNQTALYLASLWQYDYGIVTTVFPSIITRILLYVMSSRYSLMLTQIEAHTKEMRKRHLIWGQEVEGFLYWRPPQANVSLSVTIINYEDEMRFAIMADAELAPAYTLIVSEYQHYIRQLAEEAENYSGTDETSVKTRNDPAEPFGEAN